MIQSTLRASLIGAAATLLIACNMEGGSRSSSSPPPPDGNRAPTISVANSFDVLIGRVLKIRPTASDSDGDSLTYSVANKPAWMSFSTQTGVLTGTPGAGDAGVYNIVITVSDGKAKASDQARVAVVQAVAGRATLSWQAPSENLDGSPLTDLAGFRVYYGNSVNDLRYVIQVADPGARSHVIEDLTVGTWYFAATAYNRSGGESSPSDVASKKIT